MPQRRLSRLSALVIAFAVGLSGALLPSSAMADEVPTGDVIEETTTTTTEDGAADHDHDHPADESGAPTEEPSEQAPAADSDATVEYAGTLSRLSHGPTASADSTSKLLHVSGLGYLAIDVAGVDYSAALVGAATFRLAVPEGIELTGDDQADFDALATAGRDITVLSVSKSGSTVSPFVVTTPTAKATHKVYAVLVTPSNGTQAANQTAVKVQNAVTYVDGYWNQQSSGSVRFSLAGTTSWATSAFACDPSVAANATNLWNQAATRARAQLGYEPHPNNHLVLFFPSNQNCNGTAGLATVGWNANEGGLAWVIGTDASDYERLTLAHELGHNLSLGHGAWLDCSSGTPTFTGPTDLGGCSTGSGYGDVTDTMGGAGYNANGGALSSPSAIRAGIWAASASTKAKSGTTKTYTLNSVSGNKGLRSVIVQDTTGVEYFVEFRDYTDEDAPYQNIPCPGASPHTAACGPAGTDQVRVLRFEQNAYGYKPIFGDDTLLIGRTVGGVKRAGYVAGESFTQSSGLKVEVVSISGSKATVKVTAPKVPLTGAGVVMYQSWTSDPAEEPLYYRVGDVLHVVLGSNWKADSVKYQWLRNGKAISGATKVTYTLAAADLGKAIKVKVTGTTGTKSTSSTDPSSLWSGYGPIQKGIMAQGTVSIDATAYPFRAVPSGWSTPKTTLKYQWFRDGVKIKGATKATYTPVAADNGKSLTVTVTGSRSGFDSKSATSASRAITGVAITMAKPIITGTVAVGKTLSIVGPTFEVGGTPIASPIYAFQWYRSGAAISGATASTYVPTSKDRGKKLTVKVTGGGSSYVPASSTSIATVAVAKGTITGSLANPVVTKTTAGTKITLSAAHAAGAVTEAGTKTTFQWLRDGKAISKATKQTYVLTSKDYGKVISVRLTVTKSAYNTVKLTNTGANYSVMATPAKPIITGAVAVGQSLSVGSRSYSPAASAAYQWYADGKAISGATSSNFTVTAAQKGKKLTVKVTATAAGFLTSTATSAATQKVGQNLLDGWNATPSVSKSDVAGKITLTATNPVTTAGVTTKYQWLRNGKAISKATKPTYVLTSSDYKKEIAVRVTTSKSTYTTLVTFSPGIDYSLVATGVPTISDTTPTVAQTLSVSLPGYNLSPDAYTYQWYADGKAISGATSSNFTVANAQKGKKLTVKVVAKKTGYLASTTTSAKTSKVAPSGVL